MPGAKKSRSFTSPTRWKSKFARGGGLRSSEIAPGAGERIDRRDGTIRRRRRLHGWTFSDKVEGRTGERERSTTQRDRWSERLFGRRAMSAAEETLVLHNNYSGGETEIP